MLIIDLLNNQRGDVAIFIAISALLFLLIAGITVYVLVFSQLNMAIQEDQSVKAFYAADSGAEICLYYARHGNVSNPCYDINASHATASDFTNGASYDAWRVPPQATGSSLHSTGTLKNTSRKVELVWE